MIHALINRVRYELPAGTSMLEALSAAGIRLPALCHDQRLAASGACRSCLVRINGHARPVTACTTRLADGMSVETDTPDLEAGRRALLHMLVRHYPASALQRFPDKPFHRAIDEHQLGGEAAPRRPIPACRISRIPTSPSTCRAASTATGACASATRSRDSSCGTCATAAWRRASFPMDRRCARARA